MQEKIVVPVVDRQSKKIEVRLRVSMHEEHQK
jgi:hypothetical protein